MVRAAARLPLFFLAASLVAGFLLRAPRSQRVDSEAARQSPRARTAVAATGELVKSLRIGGTIGTLRSAAIRAPELRGSHVVGWAVLTLVRLADAGSSVEAGDVVAEFELKRLEDHIADLQSYVTQAQASLRKRRSEIRILQGAWQHEALRARAESAKAVLGLPTAEVLSAIEAEILRMAAAVARARGKRQAEVERLRALVIAADLGYFDVWIRKELLHIERHSRDYKRLRMKTPIGGMVIRETIFNRSGEYAQVKAGDRINSGALFMRIADTSQMVVRAMVNQVDARTIRVGNRAVVQLDAYPGLRFSGHVAEMAALASPRRGTRSAGRMFIRQIPVRILIEDKDKRVLPGLSASVDVIVSMGQRGVLIPREALQHETGQQAGTFVRVAEGGEYRKRHIAVQGLSDTEALIRSGLAPGEQVLLKGLPRDQRR
ncbi:MAG: HlyD family efflux transporter periplasmic adaptor subunit [Chloroflexi bacterium]|nr:HlyD family efflux transporter periplasmic adaptor subunit [Chloroflexota bacterium]